MYFYPKPVQERAIEIGLTTQDTVRRKRKHFMVLFYIVMLTALLLIIGLWNRGVSRNREYSFCSDVGTGTEKALRPHIDMDCRGNGYGGVSCFDFLSWRWKG